MLHFICIYTCLAIEPVIVRGNKMYKTSGERFYIIGITYGYIVNDDVYDDKSRVVFDEYLKELHDEFNTVRIYNVNPDKSYKKFMGHMEDLGVYGKLECIA